LVRYKDGAGDTTDVTKVVTYSKSKRGVPNVEVAVTPTAQSIQSNSRGSGSAVPQTLTITALEGGVNRFTGFGTIVSTNGLTINNTNPPLITFTSNAGSMTSDSGTVTIPVNFTDSEGVSGTKTVVASVSRVRSSAPVVNISASPQSQTVVSGSVVGFGTPNNVTVVVNEGGSNYTYNTSGASTFNITSVSNATNNGNGTITPNTPNNLNGTSGVITLSYRNSEDTSFTGRTIDFEVGVTGIGNSGATGATGAQGPSGSAGASGATGADGRRTATGMVFYQLTSGTAPSTPSATSYTFSSNSFTSLTSNWDIGAPTYTAGNSNKYWYSTYTVVETTAGGGTGVPTFSASTQAINFTGLVTFTSTNKITDGTNILENIPSGSITNHIGGPNVTTIEGGKISTGIITSTGYATTNPDDGQYMLAGTIFNLNNGSLRSKNFYINSSGDAFFKGNLTGASGTFSGTVSGATLTGNTITGGSISIGAGSPAPFSVDSAGNVVANSATIGGWSVNSTGIFKTQSGSTIRLNSADNKIELLEGTSTRFEVSTGTVNDPSTEAVPLRSTIINNGGFVVNRDSDRYFRHNTIGGAPFPGKSRVFNDSKGGMRVDGLFFHSPFESDTFYTGTDNGSTTNAALDPTQWLPKTQEAMIYDRPGEAPGFITYTNGSRIYNQSNLKDGGGLSMAGFTFRLHTGSPESDSNYGINTLPLRFRIDENGTVQVLKDIQCYQNVIAYFSDKRLKNIEGRIQNPLDKIQKLNGVYYTQGEVAESLGYEKDNTKQVGLIAQEVQEVLPEIVSIAPIDNDGKGGSITGEDYLTIDYSKVVPLLVECIKELKAEIEELKKNK
jgi:hypothetical protein